MLSIQCPYNNLIFTFITVNNQLNDKFREKVGSIVKRSVSRDDAGDGHNVAGSHCE